jgi:hypothetical protein
MFLSRALSMEKKILLQPAALQDSARVPRGIRIEHGFGAKGSKGKQQHFQKYGYIGSPYNMDG